MGSAFRRTTPAAAGFHRRTNPAKAGSHAFYWREIPAWAQAAAAVLLLGVAAGLANLDIRYDGEGLRVRTGWLARCARRR